MLRQHILTCPVLLHMMVNRSHRELMEVVMQNIRDLDDQNTRRDRSLVLPRHVVITEVVPSEAALVVALEATSVVVVTSVDRSVVLVVILTVPQEVVRTVVATVHRQIGALSVAIIVEAMVSEQVGFARKFPDILLCTSRFSSTISEASSG